MHSVAPTDATFRRTALRVPAPPLTPLLVLLFGALVAVLVGFSGVNALRQASQDATEARARWLGFAIAETLAETPRREWQDMLSRMSGKVRALECFVLDADGSVVVSAANETHAPVTLLELRDRGRGELDVALGEVRFESMPIGPPGPQRPTLLVLVHLSRSPPEVSAYLASLVSASAMFLAVACLAGYLVARDGSRDVAFVTAHVRTMAQSPDDPLVDPLPLRALDDVGVLTASFNELLGRYRSAEARHAANVERTRQADRDRAAFLAAVSHEFYTPLNAILGFADVLLAEVDGPLRPDAREEVEQIRDSGKHLKDLIDDIVQFSALEGGQLRLKKKRADLVALAHEVVREASVVAHEKGITLAFRAPAPVHADIDGLRMRQVLGNLVGNAVKFTSRGGVEVEISRRDRSPMITVTDTGPGISKAERSYVFDEFVQAEAGRRAGTSGSGLGLAIARRLVLLHGGSIELESEVGQGSTFRVLLPEAGAVERFGVGPAV